MKLNIETIKLNAILDSVSKGVGNIRVLPITEYILIELKEGQLKVKATDSINFVTYTEKGYEGEDGQAVVKAAQFMDLVKKTTKTEIKLQLKDSHLEVIGNGTYKVELNTEDEFPTYEFKYNESGVTVPSTTFSDIFQTNYSAIASDMIMPCLTGYNLGKGSTTTDGVKMCINENGIDMKDNILISQKQAELISSLNSDKVNVQVDGNKMIFKTNNVEIFGVEMDDKEQYPDIEELAQLEGESKVTLKRQPLLQSLQRLALFVNIFENGGVTLGFRTDKLHLKDVKENSSEEVAYEKQEIKEEAEVSVSVRYLIDLIEALKGEEIELQFTNDGETPLIIKDGKVVQLLSIMEKAEA